VASTPSAAWPSTIYSSKDSLYIYMFMHISIYMYVYQQRYQIMLCRYVYSIPSALGRRKDVPSGTSDDGGTAVVASGLSHSSPTSMTSRIAPFDQGMESGETASSSSSSSSSSSKRGAWDPERIQHRPTSQSSQPNAEIVSPSSLQQMLVLPHQTPPDDLAAPVPTPDPTIANSPGVMQHFDERRAYYSSCLPQQQQSSSSLSSHRLGLSSDYRTERFSARLSDDAAVSHGISPSEDQSDNWMRYIAPIPNTMSMMGSSPVAFTQPDHRLVRLSRSTMSQQYPHLSQNTTRPGPSSYFLPPTGTRPHSLLPGTATAQTLHVAHPSQHRTYSVGLINPLYQRRPAANSALKSWTQYEYS